MTFNTIYPWQICKTLQTLGGHESVKYAFPLSYSIPSQESGLMVCLLDYGTACSPDMLIDEPHLFFVSFLNSHFSKIKRVIETQTGPTLVF